MFKFKPFMIGEIKNQGNMMSDIDDLKVGGKEKSKEIHTNIHSQN